MRSIMWAYPWDLLGEGLETALGTIKDTARQTGISVAVSYHHGRFLNPQGERPALRFAEGSRVYFQPNLRLYGEIRPNVATLAQTRDPLAETVRAAERAGLAVHAWTVVLHNTSLGTQRPDLCLQTPFGDPLIHSVCPANPSVRAYAQALAHDLAHGRGLAEIELEAVNYLGFGHGYHHEKTGVPLDGWHAFLLGLCFCPHCRAAAKAAGADAARVH
ncbi:MAG: hypothetical protein FJ029_06390, partial [Actinobacteria bacterium]|nr:hypothetical protein [Actinomycetota bacterium]